ncbi:unnamed protein product [Ceutorhynchus assimilis]|uniref:Lariat debranching enzyme C-terminal domain-containing protein n=1 Tax=Ceutorhynchus assimilis TaxID=467358 RepID=A0A9N9MEJ8_9CUCU|nr:unnamed protein product [Ceutorhynchus assimilis]
MKIAVEGCAHGELERIYATISSLEQRQNIKIDLLICCGDFQASRNAEDLTCMAVPPKYRDICSFYKYFSGEIKAPLLTIFIGGNHEASNYLQELPYGGWVAPNIYYLGYAGVINVAGVRIGGISGIYKSRDYLKGHFERPPYDENTKRSVYHIRNLEVFRLKQLSGKIDVFLSHDWPTGVYHHGNVPQLLKKKPFFKDEIYNNSLGSQPSEELLKHLKPSHWFAAHLHCKFTATVPHPNNQTTEFLALDKCLPKRHYLQVVEIPHDETKKIQIEYDLEWLSILYLTNHLLSVKTINNYMPGPTGSTRYFFTPTDEEKEFVLKKMHGTLKVPKNFQPTATAYNGSPVKGQQQPKAKLNPQTVELCESLTIDDPIFLISEKQGLNLSVDNSFLENTTFIDDSDEDDIDTNNMTPMKLPEPSLTSTPNLNVFESELEQNTSTPKRNNEEEVSNLEAKIDSQMNTSTPKRNNEEEVSNLEPKSDSETPKKFKRRNVSMYDEENTS